jgi:hypothetical protein
MDVPSSPIELPSAWRAADCENSTDWQYILSDEEIAEIDSAMRRVSAQGMKVTEIGRDDFPLPKFSGPLADMLAALQEGRGFAIIRGLPVDRYTMDEAAIIFWGIGNYLGRPHCQTPKGDYLCHVRDIGGDQYKDPTIRSQRTRKKLPFHTDQADVVGLICLQSSKSGGLSRISSGVSVHNEILKRRPDLLPVLYGPFYCDVRGEEPEGREPYFVEPRFAKFRDKFFIQHGRTYIDSAQRFPDVPRMSDAQNEGMELIDEIANSDDFRFDYIFQPGDMQFLNNHLILHSRTEYEDYEEADRKRHLLRLWLRTPEYAELPPYFDRRLEYMEIWSRNGPRVEALG